MILTRLISRMLKSDVNEYSVPSSQHWRVFHGSLYLGILDYIKIESKDVYHLHFIDETVKAVHTNAELEVEVYTLSEVIF